MVACPSPVVAARRPDGARSRILDSALQLFADGGFDATATARIATVAGVPKSLVYYYFPAKLDLLLALARECIPGDALHLDRSGLAGMTVAELVPAVATRMGDRIARAGPLPTVLLREAGRHPAIRTRQAELFTAVRAHLSDLLAEVLPSPPADQVTVQVSAHLLAATLVLHGIVLRDLEQATGDLRAVGAFLEQALQDGHRCPC